jgi:hypothetical protein
MEKIKLKYRTWAKGKPPRPIRLTIPGWGGDSNRHDNGAEAQPWHCTPFVEGSCYGLELIYPFDAECVVRTDTDGKVHFEGHFDGEETTPQKPGKPPFGLFAPGHYGMTSCLDLLPPEGHVFRLEPHPRFYTDRTGEVPIVVPGHIQRFWPKIFFVVFKTPWPGQRHVFRKDEPYGQILILPQKVAYDVQPMSAAETFRRERLDANINRVAPYVRRNKWTAASGDSFDDKYKQLARIYSKTGDEGFHDAVRQMASKLATPKRPARVIGHKRHHEAEKSKTENLHTADLHPRDSGATAEGQHPPPAGDQGDPT